MILVLAGSDKSVHGSPPFPVISDGDGDGAHLALVFSVGDGQPLGGVKFNEPGDQSVHDTGEDAASATWIAQRDGQLPCKVAGVFYT